MKKTIFSIFLLFAPLAVFATGYDADIIYIDGIKWELLDRPVYADSTLKNSLKAALPKERTIKSSNWDGFTTFWSIQGEKLCLDSIQYELYDGATRKYWTECVPTDTLLRVFRQYVDGERIVATWFSYDIRAAKGKMIYYRHSFFERNYENERIISIVQGRVREVKDYENYVKDGYSFDDSSRMQTSYPIPRNNAELRELFPLHLDQYPELADAKRILFSIRRARVDQEGRLVECEVRVLRPDDNPRLAAEMAEALKAIHPWRVFFINGEFRPYAVEGYSFPYVLE